jgi:subtilisin family serine protease
MMRRPKGTHMGVSRLKGAHTIAAIGVLVGATGCGGDGGPTSPPAPSAIAVVSGNSQAGTVGQPLAQPLVVRVTTATGPPATGATVSFATTSASGSLSATSAHTDAQGQASVTWTLGPRAGANVDTATATASGLAGSPIVFVASATAGVPSQITSAGGNNQTGPAATTLSTPLSVKVSDSHGNPVAGVNVGWAILTGGGSVSVARSPSGANGLGTTQLTLGREPGPQTVSASAAGLTGSPVTFTATATPNGTISGTITRTLGLLAAPRAIALSSARTAVAGPALVPPPRTTVRVAPGLATSSPRAVSRPSPPAYTPNDLIVTFRHTALGAPVVGSAALAAPTTARVLGAAMHSHLASTLPAGVDVAGISPTILSAKIHVADATQRDAVAAALQRDPAIAAVGRNGLIRLDAAGRAAPAAATTTPNDALYPLQSWHYGLIGLPRAWSLTTGSTSVLVAVVDQGIRFDHPWIAANLTSDGYDFVSDAPLSLCGGGTISSDGDGDGGYDPDPTQPANYLFDPILNCATSEAIGGHGLHVAGTIGAVGNDAVGVTGVNWTVRIRPVRVMDVAGNGTSYDIAQGILYAAGLPADNGAGGTVTANTGAKVINLSLGGAGDTILHSAVIAASKAGVLIVAAAGNNASSTPFYPAAYPEVLAVSAVGPGATLASYSNFGSYIAIAAPGGDFAVGDASDAIFSTLWNFGTASPTYGADQGTSMAAPHVTGVAALLLAQNPSLTAGQLRSRLTGYAVNIGPASSFGAGLVNAYNSLTQTFGPPTQLYARLYNATTGAIVQTVPAQGGGAYAFTGLSDGQYDVYAGTDESGDQQLGIPGRLWGAYGGSAVPTSVTVAGAAAYPASFSIGLPSELEPNATIGTANALAVGGSIYGSISNPSTDLDAYRVKIPQAGSYTFETSGWIGACGFALEENTVMTLYDSTGIVLTSNDDIDAAHFNYCSRITAALNAGTYYIGITGYFGRRYRLQARAGP